MAEIFVNKQSCLKAGDLLVYSLGGFVDFLIKTMEETSNYIG